MYFFKIFPGFLSENLSKISSQYLLGGFFQKFAHDFLHGISKKYIPVILRKVPLEILSEKLVQIPPETFRKIILEDLAWLASVSTSWNPLEFPPEVL